MRFGVEDQDPAGGAQANLDGLMVGGATHSHGLGARVRRRRGLRSKSISWVSDALPMGEVPARLNVLAFGAASAVVLAVAMLAFGILAMTGRASAAEAWMESVHVFYAPTGVGIFAGVLETAVFGFVMGAPIAWAYNRFTTRKPA